MWLSVKKQQQHNAMRKCAEDLNRHKCNSKLQRDIISHHSEWLPSKHLQTISDGYIVEKTKPFCYWECKLV